MKTALLRLVAATLLFPAVAVAREPQGVSVRDYYEWQLTLDREGNTKAAVGPVDAEHALKIRLDPPVSPVPSGLPNESVSVCILERYCETVPLVRDGDPLARSPEVDFSAQLQKISEEYGRPGAQGLGKLVITIQRVKPAVAESISLSVKAETDHTVELPAFSVVSELVAPQTVDNTTAGAAEHDGMGIKTVDLPPATHARTQSPNDTPDSGKALTR